MDKLDKAYEAVDLLETLGLPVSNEQSNAIAQMEKDYIRDEIIPLIKQELEPTVQGCIWRHESDGWYIFEYR